MGKIRNTLGALAFSGLMAITGCGENHSQYTYDGKIGEDHVQFEVKLPLGGDRDNYLTVNKSDGRKIVYYDKLNSDLKIESVYIEKGNVGLWYLDGNDVGKIVVSEAQKQFDMYLEQIKQEKIRQGLEGLK